MDKLEKYADTSMKISLDILKNQRAKMFSAVKENTGVKTGLVETSAVAEVYFSNYIVEWLLNHWSELCEKTSKYSNDDQREIYMFFTKYCLYLYNKQDNEEQNISYNFIKILEGAKEVLEKLKKFPDTWEEQSKEFELWQVRRKKEFKKLIERLKKEKQEI